MRNLMPGLSGSVLYSLSVKTVLVLLDEVEACRELLLKLFFKKLYQIIV
jgi:hypothetical protein